MSAGKEFHRRVREFLQSVSATEIAYVDGKKHGRFTFNYKQQNLVCFVSSSPSCPFAHKHAMGDIRRMIKKVDNG